jgi:hypothetical protein
MKQVLQRSPRRFKTSRFTLGWFAGFVVALTMISAAGAQTDDHGRKWKPLPPLAHVVVTVVKGFDGKPLPNVAVIFHAVRDGRDDGNLEVKTDPEGKATIDVIEVGSDVNVQVIANGFATYAQDISVTGPTKLLDVKMLRPREQVSQYQNNDGKAAAVKPGVQEPPHPAVAARKSTADQPLSPATPAQAPQPQTPQTQTGTPQ